MVRSRNEAERAIPITSRAGARVLRFVQTARYGRAVIAGAVRVKQAGKGGYGRTARCSTTEAAAASRKTAVAAAAAVSSGALSRLGRLCPSGCLSSSASAPSSRISSSSRFSCSSFFSYCLARSLRARPPGAPPQAFCEPLGEVLPTRLRSQFPGGGGGGSGLRDWNRFYPRALIHHSHGWRSAHQADSESPN